MTYAQEQRIRMIDFLLANYGYIQRDAIMDYFGTSPASATRDIATYRKMAPLNVYLDVKTKHWHRTASFNRIYS